MEKKPSCRHCSRRRRKALRVAGNYCVFIVLVSTKACLLDLFSQSLKRHDSTLLIIRWQQLGTRKKANRLTTRCGAWGGGGLPTTMTTTCGQQMTEGSSSATGTESKESPSGMLRIVSGILSIQSWLSNSSSFVAFVPVAIASVASFAK